MSDITPTQELDGRNLQSAELSRLVDRALTSLAGGDVLKVFATDRGSLADLTALVTRQGHRIVEQREGVGEIVLSIRKGG